MITVTLYGRASDWTYVTVDGSDSFVAHISDPDTTVEVSLPDNTRLLVVRAYDDSGYQPGIPIELSNGFITGSHWKCTHSAPGSWYSLTYNDSVWPQAVTYSWPWGEHDLHPAQYISGEGYGSEQYVWCRGWVSKYTKQDE